MYGTLQRTPIMSLLRQGSTFDKSSDTRYINFLHDLAPDTLSPIGPVKPYGLAVEALDFLQRSKVVAEGMQLPLFVPRNFL